MNGRYGPYLTNGTDNFKLPKGVVAEKLTYQECLDIIKNTTPTAKKDFLRKIMKMDVLSFFEPYPLEKIKDLQRVILH